MLCPPVGAVASASFLGPSPGTREGVLLAPDKKIERIHAVLLTGGSAFGLSAATGVVRFLEEQGVGHPTPAAKVPLVASAVVYDLLVGDSKVRPGEAQGYEAASTATTDPVPIGLVGAGTGTTAGKYGPPETIARGGLGSSYVARGGASVGCVAVVNPIGDVVGPSGEVLAGPGTGVHGPIGTKAAEVTNTTLLVLATSHAVTKPEAKRFADAAQAALARVIRPSHTPFDGDAAFFLSSADLPAADALLMTALVQDAVQEAVWSAIER